jgi:hypothetical protein
MLYKAKVAVCSEIRTKHINAMWAPRRIFLMLNLIYVKLPLGFKRLNTSGTELGLAVGCFQHGALRSGSAAGGKFFAAERLFCSQETPCSEDLVNIHCSDMKCTQN